MSTKIHNIEGLTLSDVQNEIARGGKFVVFSYTISVLVMTFKRPTDIYFVKADESAFKYGWTNSLVTLFLGWWGIPWGPIYSIWSIFENFGGKNVTNEVMASLTSHAQRNLETVEVAEEVLEGKQ